MVLASLSPFSGLVSCLWSLVSCFVPRFCFGVEGFLAVAVDIKSFQICGLIVGVKLNMLLCVTMGT